MVEGERPGGGIWRPVRTYVLPSARVYFPAKHHERGEVCARMSESGVIILRFTI